MDKIFQVHMLNAHGKTQATAIAEAFNVLLDQIIVICPESRELAIAKTKLEEACFFAKKAMASQLENQEI